jgi:release factor glutamine methyltransferase
MNALDTLRSATEILANSGIEDAGREAELILSHCLGTDRAGLYANNPRIPEDVMRTVDISLQRRSTREPLQYIIGYTEFCGLKIKVGPGVLIPRPETELLAEEAMKILSGERVENMLDLCTGSGCLALALAKAFPGAQVYGTDISEIAIHYARENAEINGIGNVTFLQGSLFEPIQNFITSHHSGFTFDLITANPPYIKKSDIEGLQPEIRDWEPVEALDGGEDGVDYYRRIMPEAGKYLKERGHLIFELGIDQAGTVQGIAKENGFSETSLIKDFSGIERILILKKE